MIMDIINPIIAAAEREIICSLVTLGSIIIGSATGTLLVIFGFDNLFILSGIIVIISICILTRVKNLDKIKWKLD